MSAVQREGVIGVIAEPSAQWVCEEGGTYESGDPDGGPVSILGPFARGRARSARVYLDYVTRGREATEESRERTGRR